MDVLEATGSKQEGGEADPRTGDGLNAEITEGAEGRGKEKARVAG